MKKIIILLLAILSVFLTSCDLKKGPITFKGSQYVKKGQRKIEGKYKYLFDKKTPEFKIYDSYDKLEKDYKGQKFIEKYKNNFFDKEDLLVYFFAYCSEEKDLRILDVNFDTNGEVLIDVGISGALKGFPHSLDISWPMMLIHIPKYEGERKVGILVINDKKEGAYESAYYDCNIDSEMN